MKIDTYKKILLSPYNAIWIVCQLLNDGVAAVIGPQSSPSASHVQSVCDVMEVPHFETNVNFRSIRGNFAINLYPQPEVLTRVW